MGVLVSRKNRSGFTLLELIVVVAIILLLTGLLFPNLKSAMDDAKISKVLRLRDALRQAAVKYWYDTETLPVESEALGRHDLFVNPGGELQNRWKGPYLDHPLVSADNPWRASIEMPDTCNGMPSSILGGYSLGSWTMTDTGPGGELILRNVPTDFGDKIDLAIDGAWAGGAISPCCGACEYDNDIVPLTDVYIFLFRKQ